MFSKIWVTKLNYEKQTDLFASNDAHGVYMLVYEEETGKIIKACMNVFNELGNGFLEAVYQEALVLEFGLMKIPYKKEAKIDIYYKGNKLNKEYYADFICYDKIIVETARGLEFGLVASANHKVDDSEVVKPLKKVVHHVL